MAGVYNHVHAMFHLTKPLKIYLCNKTLCDTCLVAAVKIKNA